MANVSHTMKVYDDGRDVLTLGPLSYSSVQYTKKLKITVDVETTNQLINIPANLKLLIIRNQSPTTVKIYQDGESDQYDLTKFCVFSNTSTQFRVDNDSETVAVVLEASYIE